MRKSLLRSLAALALLAVLSFPHDSASQACLDPAAARVLYAGALADAAINPPSGEDNQFFTSSGGIPNIFFLMDTGVSMARLPPNGPISLGLPGTGVAGCGATAALGGLGAQAATMTQLLGERTYHSPCGTVRPGVENQQYLPLSPVYVDYWAEARACPYYTQGASALVTPSTGGYDPDWNGDPPRKLALFPQATSTATDAVYHGFGAESLPAFKHNPDKPCTHNSGAGWNFANTYPYKTATVSGNRCDEGAVATIAQFCADQGASSAICNTCLTTLGWYYDGTYVSSTTTGTALTYDGMANVTYPSVWYTGNYLNFFPPKFVVARKLVKDVIGAQLRVRMTIGGMSATGFAQAPPPGGEVGPSCSLSLNDSGWVASRSTVVKSADDLTWGGSGTWKGVPVVSQALFDVGRYYHTPTLPWFGSYWESTSTWPSAVLSADSDNQRAVCWSCQVSAVILLSDGVTSPTDGTTLPSGTCSIANSNASKYAGNVSTGIIPNASGNGGCSTSDCPGCGHFTGASDYRNNLARTAFYLHNYDMRNDPAGSCSASAGGKDGRGMPGKQVLDLYTVGFAAGANSDGARAMNDAAKAGGGTFVNAEAADDLKAGLTKAFNEINTRATSFSVATVSTLQTTTGHSVIVPRFIPSRAPDWQGHLSRYELYSEFVNSCIPFGAGDLDCDGLCASVFLTDQTGAFIAEDGNGAFVLTTDGKPPCTQTQLCGRCSSTGNIGNVPATPWWDAYDALKQQTWLSRYVYTVVDRNRDGKLTPDDYPQVRLNTQDVTADLLSPYMALGSASGGVCDSIADKISTAGDPVTAQVVRTSKRDCAKAIIRWLLGGDVFNESERTATDSSWPWPPLPPDQTLPGSSTNLPIQDNLGDRPFKLGDIYHSSPVVVDPPLPSDGILCPNGLHNQCIESLWRTPVKHVADVNQYDLYSKSTAYQYRRKMILVGANDGLLHAFNGGTWHPGEKDLVAWNGGKGIDTSKPPFSGYYDRGEMAGGPQELWAFLPPDLLGKVPLAVASSDHHLFVDGTAMVRDVWVDGADNGHVLPAANLDGKKSASEFHTVAVVGERRGGTHYFALDVTNATESGAEPKFLWVYPQPNSAESFQFGETYDDFLPVPPPIGPVRIHADSYAEDYGLAAKDGSTPTMAVPGVVDPVPYHELWVTILPGGYDPSYLRGRGVHMVDVWSGREIWDFSYPTADHPASAAIAEPRSHLQYPILATPAMVMWGKQARRPSLAFENDGYFDTATFGDMGGQLWVLRFNRPGQMDSTHKVNDATSGNWWGARIFVQGKETDTGSFCPADGGLPFSFITANTALPGSHVYRIYAGTGDRPNLLDTNGGICGPNNLRACATKGCTVTMDTGSNFQAEASLGLDAQGLSQSLCPTGGSSDSLFSRSPSTAGGTPACTAVSGSRVSVTGCQDATSNDGFTKDAALRCIPDAVGNLACYNGMASNAGLAPNPGTTVAQVPNLARPQSLNWYFSLKVFEDSGERTIFDTQAAAANYDHAALQFRSMITSVTEPINPDPTNPSSIVVMDGSSNAPATLADSSSTGWAIYYNHGPQVTTNDHTYNVSQLDERTSSVTAIYGKVFWNALQPALTEAVSAVGGCAQSKCTAASYRVAYHYAADAVTGGPALTDSSGNLVRAIVSNTLVPAQGDQPTVFVNQKGQLAVGLTSVNPEKGASNVGMSAPMDPVMGVGMTEVSRALHACRHFVPSGGVGAALTATDLFNVTAACK